MDMNNPKKRSFSLSGLPQGLNQDNNSKKKKRRKKPSKSRMKTQAPVRDVQQPLETKSPKKAEVKQEATKVKQKQAAPTDARGPDAALSEDQRKAQRQRKKRRPADKAATLLGQHVKLESVAKPDPAEIFQMDWSDIEQRAAQSLAAQDVDWRLVTPEQRRELEERYIGRPHIKHEAHSAADCGDENDDASIDSSSSDSDSDSEDGRDDAQTLPAYAGTSMPTAAAPTTQKPSLPGIVPDAILRRVQQQPPTDSLQEKRPFPQQIREPPRAASRATGRGTLKPLQERRPSSAPIAKAKQVSLADTQAKFERLTAALDKGQGNNSSDESSSSSSSSESESDEGRVAKKLLQGSFGESFAASTPKIHDEHSADLSAHGPPAAATSNIGNGDGITDAADHVEDEPIMDGTPGSILNDLATAPVKDIPSGHSSSSGESSEEEDVEAAEQPQQLVASSATSAPQKNEIHSSSESSEDETSEKEMKPRSVEQSTGAAYRDTTIPGEGKVSTEAAAQAEDEESTDSSSSSSSSDMPEQEAVAETTYMPADGGPRLSEPPPEQRSDVPDESEDESESVQSRGNVVEEVTENNDAPDFILNEDGEIVLAASSSVLETGTSDDAEKTAQTAGDAHDEAVDMEGEQLNGEEMNDQDGGRDFHDKEFDDGESEEDAQDMEMAEGQASDESSNDEETEDKEADAAQESQDVDPTDPTTAAPDDFIQVDTDEEASASDPASVSDRREEVHDPHATAGMQREGEPMEVVQATEETSIATQRHEAPGIRDQPSRSSATANFAVKSTRSSQDLGGTDSGLSQDLPVQASKAASIPDNSHDDGTIVMDVEMQDIPSLIEDVSNSVFADTRSIHEIEDLYPDIRPAGIKGERSINPGNNGHSRRNSRLVPPVTTRQPEVQECTSLQRASNAPAPELVPFELDDESSVDEDGEDDVDSVGASSESRARLDQFDSDGDIAMETPAAMRKTRARTSMSPSHVGRPMSSSFEHRKVALLPPEVQAAIDMATGSPATTSAKKRKMTGNTSTHFSPPVRPKSLPRVQNSSIIVGTSTERKNELPGDPQTAVENAPTSTPQPASQKKSPVKKTGTISEHFISDRVDVYNTTAGARRKVPAGQSSSPCPPLASPLFGIIQERTCHEPFWLVIATVFLNKTTGRQAAPTFWKIREKWNTPAQLAEADYYELFHMIKHLGFQHQRTKRLKMLAAAWDKDPPRKGRRFRTLHYPSKGDGKHFKSGQVIDGDVDDCAGALEIAHLPGCGAYAYDSWRIFCRDVLRGVVATDYLGTTTHPCSRSTKEGEEGEGKGKGKGKVSSFEPEWKRVLPQDKELRACLRWMWLKEGWIWDPVTGAKRRATPEEIEKANKGDMDFSTSQDHGGEEEREEKEEEEEEEVNFEKMAIGLDVPSSEKAQRREEEEEGAADDNVLTNSTTKDPIIANIVTERPNPSLQPQQQNNPQPSSTNKASIGPTRRAHGTATGGPINLPHSVNDTPIQSSSSSSSSSDDDEILDLPFNYARRPPAAATNRNQPPPPRRRIAQVQIPRQLGVEDRDTMTTTTDMDKAMARTGAEVMNTATATDNNNNHNMTMMMTMGPRPKKSHHHHNNNDSTRSTTAKMAMTTTTTRSPSVEIDEVKSSPAVQRKKVEKKMEKTPEEKEKSQKSRSEPSQGHHHVIIESDGLV